MSRVNKHKVFISYRRETGSDLAGRIRDELRSRRYDVFLDVEDLRSGHFNTALLAEIESSTDVVVVLSENSLDRCRAEGDWFRLEIAHALKMKKNVIPVMTRKFEWPKEPLPADLQDLTIHNGLQASHELWRGSMDRLTQQLLKARPRPFPLRRLRGAAFGVLAVVTIAILMSVLGLPDQWRKNQPPVGTTKPAGRNQDAPTATSQHAWPGPVSNGSSVTQPPLPSLPAPVAAEVNLDEEDVIVCVADFKNLKPHPDFDYLGSAIAEGLTSRLGSMKTGRVVERSRFRDIRQEMDLLLTDSVDPHTAANIGRILGANRMVVGSYEVQLFPERRTINARLVDVGTSKILWSSQFQGSDQNELERQVLQSLVRHLTNYSDPGEEYRRALAMLSAGKAGEAFEALWAGVVKAPEDVARHRVAADCAERAGTIAVLLKRYQVLVKDRPDSAVVRNYLGNALLMSDARDTDGSAAAAYRRALDLAPTFAPPINNLAAIELNQQRYEQALDGFRRYTEKSPTDAEGWVNVGNACVGLIRSKGTADDKTLSDEAERAYLRGIEIDGGLARAWRGLGALYEQMNQLPRAVQAYEGSLRLNPAQADVKQRLDEIGKKLSAAEHAPRDSMLALPARLRGPVEAKLTCAAVSARYEESLRLRARGKAAEAVELCDAALEHDAQNALGWLLKADLCVRAGRQDDAARALKKAFDLRPAITDTALYRDVMAKFVAGK